MKFRVLTLAALAAGALCLANREEAAAIEPSGMRHYAMYGNAPWHGNYWHTAWGQPVALVVPPTAEMQTHYNWGVCGTRVTRIYNQFGYDYPGPYGGGMPFLPTPNWPSSTDQFGVYYVRGPWW